MSVGCCSVGWKKFSVVLSDALKVCCLAWGSAELRLLVLGLPFVVGELCLSGCCGIGWRFVAVGSVLAARVAPIIKGECGHCFLHDWSGSGDSSVSSSIRGWMCATRIVMQFGCSQSLTPVACNM